jgi:hypothetical protein
MTQVPEVLFEHLERAKKIYSCHDCGGDSPPYQVHDWIWKEAWPDYQHIRDLIFRKLSYHQTRQWMALELCFGCLSKRLKRSLTFGDFPVNLPINKDVPWILKNLPAE